MRTIPGTPIGAWSPDGTKLLQVGWVGGNDADIYVTPFLGATSVNLTNHPATDWSARTS